MQLYKKTQILNIHNLKKTAITKEVSLASLSEDILLFKHCMSSLRYAHETTGHFYRARGPDQGFIPLLSLSLEDILIVSVLEQRATHS